MALSASRKPGTDRVKVTLELSREEALRFWHELGMIVVDNLEDRAKAAYGRYCDAAARATGLAQSGTWERLTPAVREYWIAAVTE